MLTTPITQALLENLFKHYEFSTVEIHEKARYFGITLNAMNRTEFKILKNSLIQNGINQEHADPDELKIPRDMKLTILQDAFAKIFYSRPTWHIPRELHTTQHSSHQHPSNELLTQETLKDLFDRHGFRDPNIQIDTRSNHFQIQSWTPSLKIVNHFRECLTRRGIPQQTVRDEVDDFMITIPTNTHYHTLLSVFEEFTENNKQT
jgi:hypothetical protein